MADEKITNNTITIEGRKLLVNSLVNGIGIQFTHFAIGDGEAPAAPENLTGLVNELFTVNVSRTLASATETGVTLVRGSFKNSNEKGDFYWRELGVYARVAGTEDTPVLFGYVNFENEANYIPSVGVKSVIEQGIIMQIVTGSATVLYVSDPTARVTMQDIDDCLAEVDRKLLQVDVKLQGFTEEYMASVGEQVTALQNSINDAITRLNNAGTGFVKNSGDTMTGDLTMANGAKVIGDVTGNLQGDVTGNLQGDVTGDVDGSASMWKGWQLFSNITELGLTEANTMLKIGQAMPDKSRLQHATAGGDTTPVSADNFPHKTGVLEIIKHTGSRCSYTFTDSSGHRYHSAIHTSDPQWKGWILSDGSPVGSMQMFAGATAPFGYLLCQGQSLSTTTYAALFAVIGYTYGGSGTNFKLPDFRGVFPRGYDAGRGTDSGRKLGTQQQSGAPNITGQGHADIELDSRATTAGAFYNTANSNTIRHYADIHYSAKRLNFDASRSSNVYQNGLTEVRPVNLAVNFIIKY